MMPPAKVRTLIKDLERDADLLRDRREYMAASRKDAQVDILRHIHREARARPTKVPSTKGA